MVKKMYPKIKFTNETSMITTETWGFTLIDFTLYLDDYKLRSGKDLLKHYDRLNHRSLNKSVMIDKNDVPLTNVIKHQAHAALFDIIKVKLWDR